MLEVDMSFQILVLKALYYILAYIVVQKKEDFRTTGKYGYYEIEDMLLGETSLLHDLEKRVGSMEG